ncbi:MAG: ABC transporter permease [Balneolaceae bacterium]|nr:MAG: ABC transporter permease [Balneolaceae bacterium]
MNIIHFISRRYLFSKKHISLISVLTSISIAGITIGTALLIVILSVFNGFFDVIRGYLLSFDPDIRVEHATDGFILSNLHISELLYSHPDVITVSPFIEGKAMVSLEGGQNEVITIRGINTNSVGSESLAAGVHPAVHSDLSVINGRPGIVISESLVHRYRLDSGDEIALLSPTGMRRMLTQFSLPRVSRFDVRGSYDIHQISDEDIAYIEITAAQRLFNLRNAVSGYDVKLTDTDRAGRVQSELQQLLGDEYRIQTWYDLQKPLYDVMNLEKWGSYFILMIIVLVAVLNIVGSLTMIVIQKKRDIGILLSMGMTRKKIRGIFRNQGLLIGLIGCGIGGTVGVGLSLAQMHFGLVKLSSSFIIDAYPAAVQISDIVMILSGTMLLCLLASWYPSLRAAAVEPADAVRVD